MSDRIRQLEDALAIVQSGVSRDPHPLLRRELMDIKSGLTLHSATNLKSLQSTKEEPQEEEGTYIDAFGTLAVRDDGAATFYGRSAGTESLLLDEKPEPSESSKPYSPLEALPPSIQRLTAAFPSTPSGMPDEDLTELMETYLPPWPRAAQLCDLYLEQSQWFFGPITRRQLTEEVLPLFYAEASTTISPSESPPGPSQGSSSAAVPSNVSAFDLPGLGKAQKTHSAHDLALIFVVFCFGAMTDPVLPPAPNNMEAERYFKLTRAAMNIEPVIDRPPSVVTVQTLSLMAIYQGLVADENSIESTWALMGLSTRLAQSVGLHRDCARWKLSPQEVQKRRAVFWELFITDCWQSLATGRLPGLSLPFVDTELPGDPDGLIAEDGTVLPSFPLWKAKFGKEIVSAVVDCTLTAKPPKYSAILDLDRQIRDFELPKFTQEPLPENGGLNLVMSHYMPKNYREFIMLYVHRGYFAMALNDCPTDPLRSQYAPSFLAGYRAACNLLTEMRDQFAKFPIQIARFWVLWTHAFSAVVMLGSVVTHGSTTKMSQAALAELRLAKDLFERASLQGGRAVKFLPAVRRLHDKAHNVYSTGFQRKDIFSVRNPEEDERDELSIFTGRTRTVATKATKTLSTKHSISRMRKSSSHASASSMPSPPESTGTRSSDSPMTAASDSPAAEGSPAAPSYTRSLESYGTQVHPMLVDQLKEFEGQLDAQISSAEQHYTGMVAASQTRLDPTPVMSASGSGSGPAYLTPPEHGAYQSGGYQQQQQQQQSQSPYGSESSAWSAWDSPSAGSELAGPSYASVGGHYYQHPAPTHQPAQYYQQPQHPMPFSSDQTQPRSASLYAVDTSSSTSLHGHASGSDGSYQHYSPHTPIDNPSYGYLPPSHGMQDPQIWDMTPQMAEGDFAYSQHHDSYDASSIPKQPPPQPMQHNYTTAHAHDPHHSHQQGLQLHYPPQTPQMHQPQHPHTQPIPQRMMPPSSVLPIQGGAYSLAETWTSFMQQELPAPGGEMQHNRQQR